MSVTVDVWSDLVCPWCLIGSRRLERALATVEPGSVEVNWRSFQLQPDLPPEGIESEEYFAAKFGGPDRVRELHGQVAEVAAADGIELRFDLQKRAPNTLLAHRATKLADDAGAAVQALFRGHFQEGADIGDRDTVLSLVPGLDPVRLDAGEGGEEVAADLEAARQIGITGVPFFVADMRIAVSGAQPVETLVELITRAAD